MPRETTGYIQSVAYPDHFHSQQAPVHTAVVMAALGQATPGRQGTSWCEIGCGQGFTAILLASVNPGMQFHGIDINPEHIRLARENARRAGLRNITFACEDISAGHAVAESYDFITCFGLLSWVSPQIRQAVYGYIARNLAADGVATLHYMSDPGGAVLRCFHALFRSLKHRADPLEEGFALLRRMRAAEAGFFRLYPAAGPALDALEAQPRAYLAHEYLNDDFWPLPFHEVAGAMEGHGLIWQGSAEPVENIDALSVPELARAALEGEKDPVLRETLKDMARNQAIRVDLFTRQRPALAPAQHFALLNGFLWGLVPGRALPADGMLRSKIGPLQLDPALAGAVIAALQRGPQRFGDLMQSAAFRERPGLLNEYLQLLFTLGLIHPVFPGFDGDPARLLNRALSGGGTAPPALAAPAFATGLAPGSAPLSPALRALLPL